jgi:hypothetical protein
MAGRGEVFNPIELEWNGDKFVIPSDRVFGAIARVESVEIEGAGATIPELVRVSQRRGTVKTTVLAAAFGELLRYAGADVTNDEVLRGMFVADTAISAQDALLTLMTLMIPPDAVEPRGVKSPKKARPAARTASSRKRSS